MSDENFDLKKLKKTMSNDFFKKNGNLTKKKKIVLGAIGSRIPRNKRNLLIERTN